MKRTILMAILCLAAACQPLPRPFADDRPARSAPILNLKDLSSVNVAPVAGLAPDARDKLAQAMADALLGSEILASTAGGSRSSLSLLGTAHDGRTGERSITVEWRLLGADGHVIGAVMGSAPVARDSVERGDPAALKALADAAAPAVAQLLQDDMPAMPKATQATAPEIDLHQIFVRPVAGAPGDGRDALRLAMMAALGQTKLKVVPPESGSAALAVVGLVKMGKPDGGKQRITITWQLLEPGGQQLGVVTQDNAVPAGSLDGKWGDIAYLIARAAAPGIVALVAQAEQQKAGS